MCDFPMSSYCDGSCKPDPEEPTERQLNYGWQDEHGMWVFPEHVIARLLQENERDTLERVAAYLRVKAENVKHIERSGYHAGWQSAAADVKLFAEGLDIPDVRGE